MRKKLSKQARAFEAATRRHLKESRAISMLGFELESARRGEAVLRLDAKARHKQLNNVVHGGILAALADTAGAIAAYTTVPKGVALATIELKINYLRPFKEGHLKAIAKTVHQGRTVGILDCEVFDDRGKIIARSSSTCLTLRGEQTKGRNF